MRVRAAALLSLLVPFASVHAAHAAPADPYVGMQWGLSAVGAPSVWATADGSGAVVAVIDTGVDASHPDLQGRLLTGHDFVDDDDDPVDRNGHGTLISGIIAATTGNDLGGASVAPGARILPVRVLDEDGTGTSGDVAAGIRWATQRHADVINLSLANEAPGGLLSNLLADPEVDDAINEAAGAGIAVVVASGNDPEGGASSTAYDATSAGVLVVGATTRTDARAAYSNYGSGLDLVAPGGGSPTDPSDGACSQRSGIVSTWWNPKSGRSSYGAGCGTSMAVAFVSGVAAILRADGMSASDATARIVRTADDVGEPGRDAQTGAGRLNAARAAGVRVHEVAQAKRRRVEPDRSVRAQGAAPTATTSPPQRIARPEPSPSVLGRTVTQVPGAEFAFGGVRAATDPLAERWWLVTLAAFLLCALALAHTWRWVVRGPR
jgi:subtilisin family serine protease